MIERHGPTAATQHEIITDLTARLIQTCTSEDVLAQTRRSVCDILGHGHCTIYLRQGTRFVESRPPKEALEEADATQTPDSVQFGESLVGHAALSAEAIVSANTSLDIRHIYKHFQGGSEIAVPIFSAGKVIGIIDSEHPAKSFFTHRDAEMLEHVAALIAPRLSETLQSYSSYLEREQDVIASREALDAIVHTDLFTGLQNRMSFEKHLRRLDENQPNLCCAVFELDNLQHINEQQGDSFGDRVILHFSEKFREKFPRKKQDVVIARLNHNSFGIVSLKIEVNDVISMVQSLIEEVSECVIISNGKHINLSTNAGISTGHAKNLLPHATEALQQAKEAGKSSFTMWSDSFARLRAG